MGKFLINLLCVCCIFGCSGEAAQRSATDDYARRQSEPCDFKGLKGGSPAYEWQLEACEHAKAQQVGEEKRFALAGRVRALLKGECDTYFEAPDGLERLERYRPDLAAGLYTRGLCAPKDTAKAKALLWKRLEQDPSDSTAMARLGALHWGGQ